MQSEDDTLQYLSSFDLHHDPSREWFRQYPRFLPHRLHHGTSVPAFAGEWLFSVVGSVALRRRVVAFVHTGGTVDRRAREGYTVTYRLESSSWKYIQYRMLCMDRRESKSRTDTC